MWHGIMKIVDINHFSKQGKLIWSANNLKNILHLKGEEFLLRAAFSGGKVSSVIPENYYLGLDNRFTISADDEMSDINGEPSFSGYERQAVASSGDFTIIFENGHYQAISPIVAFGAVDGSWGPISNLFISDQANTLGTLISTAPLSSSVVVEDGESVTLRIAMTLKDCS